LESFISKNVILVGQVSFGERVTVENNVILGSKVDGLLAIGTDSLIRSGTVIYSGVKIGAKFNTGHNVLIREDTEIGDEVLVGTNSVIDGHCKIGSRVKIQTNVYITAYTVIENDVFIGPCAVTTNDKYMWYGAELKGAVIKKGAKIGANATILPGVTTGENAIIGAGTVVTKDVPAGETVIGNPAVRIRKSLVHGDQN